MSGANVIDAEINQIDITGANVTGAKITTGSEADKESPLSKVPIIGEMLEKINPLK